MCVTVMNAVCTRHCQKQMSRVADPGFSMRSGASLSNVRIDSLLANTKGQQAQAVDHHVQHAPECSIAVRPESPQKQQQQGDLHPPREMLPRAIEHARSLLRWPPPGGGSSKGSAGQQEAAAEPSVLRGLQLLLCLGWFLGIEVRVHTPGAEPKRPWLDFIK